MIYLDNASTTQISEEVLEEMYPYLTYQFGNPGSIHTLGESARNAVNKARAQVAKVINAEPDEIIFTSGGSEANNLAVKFAKDFWGMKKAMSSLTEHDSMKKALSAQFIDVNFCPYLESDKLLDEIWKNDYETFISSFMFVNNELGFVNPVKEICRLSGSFLIIDAVQALGHEKIDVKEIGCDVMTFSSHKIHGPKGIGALYINGNLSKKYLRPLIFGGDNQEFGWRGGTENVAGIVGFGKACELIDVDRNKEVIADLRKAFLEYLNFEYRVNFDSDTSKIISLTVPGISAETLVLMLSAHGVYISAGSACKSLEQKPNEVLLAAGLSEDEAWHTVRISLSWTNTTEEMKQAAKIFNECVSVLNGI